MKKIMHRQVVDCYSRIVGYLSPVRLWNSSKKSEFADRKVFKIERETSLEKKKG